MGGGHKNEKEDGVDTVLLEARINEMEKQLEILRKTLIRAGWIQE